MPVRTIWKGGRRSQPGLRRAIVQSKVHSSNTSQVVSIVIPWGKMSRGIWLFSRELGGCSPSIHRGIYIILYVHSRGRAPGERQHPLIPPTFPRSLKGEQEPSPIFHFTLFILHFPHGLTSPVEKGGLHPATAGIKSFDRAANPTGGEALRRAGSLKIMLNPDPIRGSFALQSDK